jgi:hypothetical protein
LRHLVLLKENALIEKASDLKSVAEIGPGDSLGIGIAALLSGVRSYYAFDVIEHATLGRNMSVADQLASLFRCKEEIPHREPQFKNTAPRLTDYRFPAELFDPPIKDFLIDERVDAVKSLLTGSTSGSMNIGYVVPWYQREPPMNGGLDLVYSQAVMEHVEDIEHAYAQMGAWLKPGGIISHQIDFKAHEMTKEWNGHWFIPERLWEFLLRGRKYSMNRLPMSAHVNAMKNAGFEIRAILPVQRVNVFGRKPVKVSRWEFNEEDMITSGALIQAVKPL